MRKALLTLLCAATAVFAAMAQTTETVDGITYSLDSSSKIATITAVDCSTVPADLTLTSPMYMGGDNYIIKLAANGSESFFRESDTVNPLTSITLSGEFAESIVPSYAFKNCSNVASIDLSEASFTEIGQEAFADCGFTTLRLNEGLTKIDYGAFGHNDAATSNPGFTELSIPASVMTVDFQAFFGNNYVTTLYLYADPEHDGTGKQFGIYAFYGMPLQNIYTLNTVPPTIAMQITFTNYQAQLHVLEGTEEAYKAAQYWQNFSIVDATLTGIEDVTTGEADDDTVEIYTLSGVRVYTGPEADAPAIEGLHIVRHGDTAKKILY